MAPGRRVPLAALAASVVLAGCANTATGPGARSAVHDGVVATPVTVNVERRPPTAGPPLDVGDLLALGPDRLLVTTFQYANDGEAGRSRIVETRDGGTTWHEVWRGERVDVTSLARRPDGTLIAFVSRSSNDRVVTSWRLTSTDGGRTWQRRRIPPVATNHGPGYAFDVTFVTNRVGSAAAGPTGGGSVPELLITHDGGLTWIRAAGPDAALAFASARIAVGIGPHPAHPGSAGLLRSTDGGARWRPIGGTRGVYGAVAFSSPTHGLAAGGTWPGEPGDPPASATLLVTDDAGATWRRRAARYESSQRGVETLTPAVPITHFVSAGPGRWWAITDVCRFAKPACVGDLLRSDDDGRRWRVAGHAIALVASGPDTAVELPAAVDGIQPPDSGLLRFTRDAGRTWRKRFARGRVQGLNLQIDPRDRSLFLDTVVGPFHSVDAGRTWTAGGLAPDLASVELDDDPRVVHTIFGRGRRSAFLPGVASGGAAYDHRSRFQFLDDRRIFLLVDHLGLFRSDDGGDSWRALARPDPSASESDDLAVSPDGRTVVITAFGARDSHAPALVSRDGGATLAELRLPAGLACETAAAVDATIVLGCNSDRTLGRDDVIAVSDDRGETFRFTRPSRDVGRVRALDASTFVGSDNGATITISRDGGRSWTAVYPDLPGGG